MAIPVISRHIRGQIIILKSNVVLLQRKKVILKTNTVTLKTNPLILKTIQVILETNPVILKTNPVNSPPYMMDLIPDRPRQGKLVNSAGGTLAET